MSLSYGVIGRREAAEKVCAEYAAGAEVIEDAVWAGRACVELSGGLLLEEAGSDEPEADKAPIRYSMLRSPVHCRVRCLEDADNRCGRRACSCGVRLGALALALVRALVRAAERQPGNLSAERLPPGQFCQLTATITSIIISTITIIAGCCILVNAIAFIQSISKHIPCAALDLWLTTD